MSAPIHDLLAHLWQRLHEVRATLGLPALREAPDRTFADALDSMGLVEYVGLLGDDLGVAPESIEGAVGRRFTTVAALAAALESAGLRPAPAARPVPPPAPIPPTSAWLAATAVVLPARRQPTSELDVQLGRPAGWLEQHAGIRSRYVWEDEAVCAGAATAARACLAEARVPPSDVGALLVTSGAPPLLVGLGADLHARLGLPAHAVPLEIGGACTGFLAALWTARSLLPSVGAVLLVAVEAPTRWLAVRPGPESETAALFGDAAAACLLRASPTRGSFPLLDVVLTADGHAGHLLRAHLAATRGVELEMDGPALATRAVSALAGTVEGVSRRHGLVPTQLDAIVVHGGNGRLPALVARQLGVPGERVWSETANTGNLGSASLPVAWAAHPTPSGPFAWSAVGAGLLWGAALFGKAHWG